MRPHETTSMLVDAIRRLVPEGIGVAGASADELATTVAEAAALPPETSAARRREFVAGRLAARAALRSIGVAGLPVAIGAHGNPRWPAGVVGSITHCGDKCIAAVAHARLIATIGIDVERDAVVDVDLELIATRRERAALTEADPRQWNPTLLFSAKEAVYKAWFPMTHAWLDFTDVELAVDLAAKRFTAMPAEGAAWQRPDVLGALEGRYASVEGFVVSAVTAKAVSARRGARAAPGSSERPGS